MRFNYQLAYGRLLPLIDVKLKHKEHAVTTPVYIDSGAFNSIFSTDLANMLELDHTKGKLFYPLGIGGHIKAYKNEITLIIGGKEIVCNVLFSDQILFSFNLLGLDPLFNNFRVCFDNRKGELILEAFQ